MWGSITYTFSPSTIAKSGEVNQNFQDLVSAVNVGMPSGGIILWSGSIASIPAGWYLCDGNNGTPNLAGKFIQGAGAGFAVGASGGLASKTLSNAEMPYHNHTGSSGYMSANHRHYDGGHGHPTNVRAGSTSDGSVSVRGASNGPTATINDGVGAVVTGYASIGLADTDHLHAIPYDGGSVAFDMRPPFYTLAYIKKS